MNKKYRNIGAASFFIFFSLLFFVLIVRFISIQYTGEVEGKVLTAQAAQLYMREDVIKAQRGSIYDNNGEVIAEDAASYTLVAILSDTMTTDPNYPRHVVDPRKTAAQLALHIDMSEQDIYDRLTQEGRFQVEFGRAGKDLSNSVKIAIEELQLPGITFIKDTKRYYPNGIFASHLIGYAQKDEESSEIVGVTGLENSYNDLLDGEDGSFKYEGDIWNYILPNSKKHVEEPVNGQDIYLTIDKKIQTFLEDAMNKVDEQYKPKRIMAVVADPKTGKILAMGQRPTYHPTTREGIDQSWHNEIIETSFEPGSTMKIFALATAIEKNVFNPNDKFASGQYCLDGKNCINDHNYGKGWGTISYLEGFQRSSNVVMAKLLEKMGAETWLEYMNKFKFGMKTNIGLPNEVPGKILYNWPIEKVTSVYGQGTTVTAIQMVQAMSAIANDGKMMKPYVVDKIVDPNTKTVTETKPEIAGNPISADTAKQVREILESTITSEHGTAKTYHIEGYRVGGKTGTAQIPNPNGKGYLKERNQYIFSFLGLAPVDNPQLVMYVAIEEPQIEPDENGSKPVSMIFNTVMKTSLQYLNIEPEKTTEVKNTSLPDLTKMKLQDVQTLAQDSNLELVTIGKGNKIVEQFPASGVSLLEGEKIIVKTDGDIFVPNMTGWSKRDVLKIAQIASLELNMVGNGYAYKQNFQPNTSVQAGDQLVVHFETPAAKIEREQAESQSDTEDKVTDE